MKKPIKRRLDLNLETVQVLTITELQRPKGGRGNYPSDTECGNCGSASSGCQIK